VAVTAGATTNTLGGGTGFALAAYGFWGVSPVYFKWIEAVPAGEILSHRIVWSVVTLVLWISLIRRWDRVVPIIRQSRLVLALSLSAALVTVNWLIYIWSVQMERLVEASLGYYINPLVAVFLGMIFLGERLRPLQWCALGLAALGVVNELVAFGSVPWIAIGLAFSFGFYGLVRKRVNVDSSVGLLAETVILLPFAGAYLAYLFAQDALVFGAHSVELDVALALAGAVTCFPLVCFAAAAQRLPLASLGFFQYVAPTIILAIAVLAYDEPFRDSQWLTFLAIWTALAIFSLDGLYHQRRRFVVAQGRGSVEEPLPDTSDLR
jgi:chloramphenicol-sensitive protein RarD